MHGRKNKENCALKLVDEIILYYDARSKKHQMFVKVGKPVIAPSLRRIIEWTPCTKRRIFTYRSVDIKRQYINKENSTQKALQLHLLENISTYQDIVFA